MESKHNDGKKNGNKCEGTEIKAKNTPNSMRHCVFSVSPEKVQKKKNFQQNIRRAAIFILVYIPSRTCLAIMAAH